VLLATAAGVCTRAEWGAGWKGEGAEDRLVAVHCWLLISGSCCLLHNPALWSQNGKRCVAFDPFLETSSKNQNLIKQKKKYESVWTRSLWNLHGGGTFCIPFPNTNTLPHSQSQWVPQRWPEALTGAAQSSRGSDAAQRNLTPSGSF